MLNMGHHHYVELYNAVEQRERSARLAKNLRLSVRDEEGHELVVYSADDELQRCAAARNVLERHNALYWTVHNTRDEYARNLDELVRDDLFGASMQLTALSEVLKDLALALGVTCSCPEGDYGPKRTS